jgi:hypothetical protein
MDKWLKKVAPERYAANKVIAFIDDREREQERKRQAADDRKRREDEQREKNKQREQARRDATREQQAAVANAVEPYDLEVLSDDNQQGAVVGAKKSEEKKSDRITGAKLRRFTNRQEEARPAERR